SSVHSFDDRLILERRDRRDVRDEVTNPVGRRLDPGGQVPFQVAGQQEGLADVVDENPAALPEADRTAGIWVDYGERDVRREGLKDARRIRWQLRPFSGDPEHHGAAVVAAYCCL